MMSSNPRSRALARPALARFPVPRPASRAFRASARSASWRRDLRFRTRLASAICVFKLRIERREETSLGRHDAKSARKSRRFFERGGVRPARRRHCAAMRRRRRCAPSRAARSRDRATTASASTSSSTTRASALDAGRRRARRATDARRRHPLDDHRARARIGARARAGEARGRTRDAGRAIADAGRRTSGEARRGGRGRGRGRGDGDWTTDGIAGDARGCWANARADEDERRNRGRAEDSSRRRETW